MRNRAKCKLCGDIIESFHPTDLVLCKCGEIQVEAGNALKCAAKDWKNFLRVDDQGNEIIVKVKEDDVKPLYNEKPSKKDLLGILDEMIKSYETLPPQAMNAYVTNYDLAAALLLLSSILHED